MKDTEVHAASGDTYTLSRAILVYESHHASAYCTVHDVQRIQGRAVIGAGRPASRANLRKLAVTLGAQLGTGGWTSPGVLYLGGDLVAWWRPPSVATLHFTEQGGGEDALEDGRAMQPGLVFAVTSKKWHVWATNNEARPDAQTKLFHAPHYNVYDDGEICTGNVKLPAALTPDTIPKYERAYFGSRFTHPNHDGITRDSPTDVWRELLADPSRPFPIEQLMDTGRTLGAVIRNFTKGAGSDD